MGEAIEGVCVRVCVLAMIFGCRVIDFSVH